MRSWPPASPERQAAEFVEDDEVHAGQIIGDAALAPGAGFGLEPVDEIDSGEEAAARSRPDAASRDCDGEMGLAGPGRGSDMAPGFWRVKRRSTTPFIRWPAERWRRAAGGSCMAALCI